MPVTLQGVVNRKKLLIVALVVLLVVIGVPVLMPGMSGAGFCVGCGPAVMAGPACALAAVLAGFVFTVALLSQRLRRRGDVLRLLLRAVVFDRPPQFV